MNNHEHAAGAQDAGAGATLEVRDMVARMNLNRPDASLHLFDGGFGFDDETYAPLREIAR